MSSPDLLALDPSTTADDPPQRFVYPALDLSKTEFRLLVLHPGQYDDDDMKAQLFTFPLPALPLSFKDGEHFTQLNVVYQALSTAVDQRIGVQFAKLLRWQRLCDELDELYWNRSLAKIHFKPRQAHYRVAIQDVEDDAAVYKLRGIKDSFIALVEEYQSTTSDPFETVELQGLIGHLRSKYGSYSRRLRLTPDCEAVSYFCGDQTKNTHIMLNDTSVKVPATAAHALRGLHYKDGVRVL